MCKNKVMFIGAKGEVVMIRDKTLQGVKFPRKTFWNVEYFKSNDLYFWMEAIEAIHSNGRATVSGRGEMILLSSYSYLGLINHPKINNAAKLAIEKYGTATNGVRFLAGTIPLHDQLESKIAEFKKAESAITFSSGYTANLSAISSLLRRGDTVIGDKLNHASITEGCYLSQATYVRFQHNDMPDLEKCLKGTNPNGLKLVVVDAVFSMDGDIINLPEVSTLCRKYNAYLMVDEAHSIGVLGQTGHGIEEHFGLPGDTVDVKMGTFSKAIPSVGGYVAGNKKLIRSLKHEGRSFIFSAAPTPPSVAAALAALEVIEEEPERIQKLLKDYTYFANKLRMYGFNLLNTQTPIIPIICGTNEKAVQLSRYCMDRKIFVHAIFPPVVPRHTSRLRVTITANNTIEDLDYCAETLKEGALVLGILSN